MTRVAFDPDAPLKPPPVLTVTPSSGLVDGQTVVVQGEHFSSNWHGIHPGVPGEAGRVVRLQLRLRPGPIPDRRRRPARSRHVRGGRRGPQYGETLDCRVAADGGDPGVRGLSAA